MRTDWTNRADSSHRSMSREKLYVRLHVESPCDPASGGRALIGVRVSLDLREHAVTNVQNKPVGRQFAVLSVAAEGPVTLASESLPTDQRRRLATYGAATDRGVDGKPPTARRS